MAHGRQGSVATPVGDFVVAGRRLADRSFTPAAAGRNAIPLAEARGLHAGIYLVRVTQGGKRAVGRALIAP